MFSRRSFLIGATVAWPVAAHAAATEYGFPVLVGRHARKRRFTPAYSPLGAVRTTAYWALISDFETGAVLLEKRADAAMPASSMAKLMTLYITYDLLRSGRLRLNEELPVSEAAWRMGGSKMFVPYPGRVSVADLILGIEVDSGNDACIVLAEAISGSPAAFAALMNRTARRMGLINSHFTNPTGLPAPDNYMCCRDITTLAWAIITGFPEYYRYASRQEFTFSGIKQYNDNPLVRDGRADGLKAGFTDGGGYGLCASASRGGRRILMVLNGLPSAYDRVAEGARLLGWSFEKFEDVVLFKPGETIAAASVWLGAHQSVPLVAQERIVATVPRDWRRAAKIHVVYRGPLRAPIAAGEHLATLVLSGNGVPPGSFPLVSGRPVPRLGIFARSFAVAPSVLRPFADAVDGDEMSAVGGTLIGAGAYYVLSRRLGRGRRGGSP